jgi:hypothetical protein
MGDKVNSGIGLFCCTGTPGYMAGGPVRRPYAGVDFIPQSGIYEFGYWCSKGNGYGTVQLLEGWERFIG